MIMDFIGGLLLEMRVRPCSSCFHVFDVSSGAGARVQTVPRALRQKYDTVLGSPVRARSP